MTTLEQTNLEVLTKHGKSFRFASFFLDKKMRRDAALTYAFCRQVDDAVDEAPGLAEADAALFCIEEMLLGRQPPSALISAYVELCERTQIGLEPALDLIAGVRSDLRNVRLRTDHELAHYCYCVAGTVGLMMCGVLGIQSAKARRHAIELGLAMQLTNICRDVLEDARMNRVYLPERRLGEAGLSAEGVLQAINSPGGLAAPALEQGVGQVVRQLLAAAELTYTSAAKGFSYIPPRPRLAIMIAGALYRGIGRRLLRTRAGNPLRGRAVVPTWERLLLAGRALFAWFPTLTRPTKVSDQLDVLACPAPAGSQLLSPP